MRRAIDTRETNISITSEKNRDIFHKLRAFSFERLIRLQHIRQNNNQTLRVLNRPGFCHTSLNLTFLIMCYIYKTNPQRSCGGPAFFKLCLMAFTVVSPIGNRCAPLSVLTRITTIQTKKQLGSVSE